MCSFSKSPGLVKEIQHIFSELTSMTKLKRELNNYTIFCREFYEFHSKLCTLYPLTKFHSLPKGLSIGRSEVREVCLKLIVSYELIFGSFKVAEKRKNEIGAFLLGLFRLADEISHSDIVYTFFHPLHRDQKEANIHINKLKGKTLALNMLFSCTLLSNRT